MKGLYEKYCGLERDLSGTKLRVNPCTIEGETAVFPFLAGRTLEEELDELLEKKQFEALLWKNPELFCILFRVGGDIPDDRWLPQGVRRSIL